MLESVAVAVAEAEARNLLKRAEVQSRLSQIPKWLSAFQEPAGFTKFEEQFGIVIPAGVKDFWRQPALVCLLDAWGHDAYLSKTPTLIIWKGKGYLTVCSHGHSSSVAAVALDAGDDPPMYYGWNPGNEYETPGGLFSPCFSAHILGTVREIDSNRLRSYWPAGWTPEAGHVVVTEPQTVKECISSLKAFGGTITFSDYGGHFDGLYAFFEESFCDRQLEWVRRFRDFDWLDIISISGCGITDQGCAFIAMFKSLVTLNLSRTKVTNAGARCLEGLPSLEFVNLSHTAIGDPAIDVLAGLPNLRNLNLKMTAITDSGIRAFGTAAQLDEVNLEGCGITDQSIPTLIDIPTLMSVNLWETQVSRHGAETLRSKRPEMLVEWGVKCADDTSE